MLNRLVDADRLEPVTLEMAKEVAARAPKIVRLLKTELRKLNSGPALNPDDFEEIQSLRRGGYQSKDFKEGITAFFEKRVPQFTDE